MEKGSHNPLDASIRDALKETIFFAPGSAYATTASQVIYFSRDYPDLDDFLIRTTALQSPDAREKLLNALEDETLKLRPAKPFFCGPKVSQSLLSLADSAGEILLDIIPLHRGITLDQYLNHDVMSYDMVSKRADALMQHLIDHPDELRTLFEQSAFIGMQAEAPAWPDHHLRNVMLQEDGNGMHLSLIDVVSSESTGTDKMSREHETAYRKRPASRTSATPRQDAAMRYIDPNEKNSMMDLFCKQVPERAQYSKTSDTFIALCKEIEQETYAKIKDGTIGQAHPEWKGFVDVSDVKAIPLTENMHRLKEQLNTLYQRAVPQAQGGIA